MKLTQDKITRIQEALDEIEKAIANLTCWCEQVQHEIDGLEEVFWEIQTEEEELP